MADIEFPPTNLDSIFSIRDLLKQIYPKHEDDVLSQRLQIEDSKYSFLEQKWESKKLQFRKELQETLQLLSSSETKTKSNECLIHFPFSEDKEPQVKQEKEQEETTPHYLRPTEALKHHQSHISLVSLPNRKAPQPSQSLPPKKVFSSMKTKRSKTVRTSNITTSNNVSQSRQGLSSSLLAAPFSSVSHSLRWETLHSFEMIPATIEFHNFEPNHVYQKSVTLKNVSSVGKRTIVLQPSSK